MSPVDSLGNREPLTKKKRKKNPLGPDCNDVSHLRIICLDSSPAQGLNSDLFCRCCKKDGNVIADDLAKQLRKYALSPR